MLIGTPAVRLRVTAELVEALVTVGELTDAERIADDAERSVHQPIPPEVANALVRIAEHCSSTPNLTPIARRLCAMVLTINASVLALPFDVPTGHRSHRPSHRPAR
jgi:hypothetical protein